MSSPFLGEIRLFAGNFAPTGWLFCDGYLLPISENEALFTLIGTTYGGDGESTFALPDLRGRVPIHQGNGSTLATRAGVEEVTLTAQQIPIHSHVPLASTNPGSSNSPGGHVTAAPPGIRPYVEDSPTASLAPGALLPSGGSQPHTNLQPYLCLNFIISLFGEFPSQF